VLSVVLRPFSVALFLTFHIASAAEPERFPSYPPTEPRDVAKTLRVKNGFTLDLIAAEPLIASPVAVAYDEDGNGYVVEMRDYPYTDRNTHQAYKDNTTDAPIGRVRKLIDRDGDGVFDESHVLADGLSWPTGVCCWKGGVFVTATPDIWYLKDTDGDHRADIREKVFTGFRKFNVQAVINTPLWGLDNRITFAGGTNGGQVTSLRHPDAKPLRIARNDLRIDPRTGTIEAIAGGARFGHGMDDWGNRFLCNIRNPAQHVVFDGTFAGRNPFVISPNPVFDARESGDTLPVKRISPLEPWRDLRARRWVAENHVVPRSELVAGGVFTSAAGITIYRGAAYPPEYRGQAFTAEVANNLVQRQTVTKDGVTFRIETADKDAEFIASTDLWFRPVNFTNAPDGTLHVVDMYRETIEHPWSIPDDIRAKLDLESGRDRGRLYRLSPPNFQPPKPPRLGRASTAELVATLENPNAWWRETAQRLLFERQDSAAVDSLRAMVRRGVSDLARVHALWTLDGLDALAPADLLVAFKDASAGVREHAVRLAATRLNSVPALREAVWPLAQDPEIRVRYQLAFAAGGVADEGAVAAAVTILEQSPGDRWVRAAVLSAPPDQCAAIARQWVKAPHRMGSDEGREVLRQLAAIAGARNQPAPIEAIWTELETRTDSAAEGVFWTGLGEGLKQTGKSLRSAFRDARTGVARRGLQRLDATRATAMEKSAPQEVRLAAVKTLAFDDYPTAQSALATLLSAQETPLIQIAAVRTLSGFAHPDVAGALVRAWPTLTPAVREEVLTALLARRERLGALLTALENNVVGRGQISAARRTQILATPDASLKVRAEKLFGAAIGGTRAEVVERYKTAFALTADVNRGGKVYDNVCAACHRFAGRGTEIGPNLETVRGWDREKLLLNILDPNREVAANYIAFVIELNDGSSVSGMITEENAGAIKLRRIGAPEETILRQNIAKITSSAQSLMPDGLEATISPQEMADLLAFLGAQ
jgi:putative membrane-bound dehydrogenase-like protein